MNVSCPVGNSRYSDPTTAAFLARHPGQAADVSWTAGELVFYSVLFLSFILGSACGWPNSALYLFLFVIFYLAVVLFRLVTVGLAFVKRPEIVVSRGQLAAADPDAWPAYTILVPLYREPEVAPRIVRHLNRLDYPREKLEVLLLLEQDDELTSKALAQISLPPHFRVVDVPDTLPRTKPKACNWGLRGAEGEYVVVYDAEDRPDPDQLKKAAVAFRKVPEHVICLQAKLSYYNPDQNILTRWFTMEYAAWFDLYMPGLYRLDLPIPLGGTSNHLRRRVLEEIGGWDPFNVTEDCDLGIRLHRLGYRTAMLDTTTWEEANSRLHNWVRQRSRWVKGYLQTHLVHTRRPLRTLRDLGPRDALSFLLSAGAHSLLVLINPFVWLATLVYLWLAGRELLAGHSFWEIVSRPIQGDAWDWLAGCPIAGPVQEALSAGFYVMAALLFFANGLFILFNLLGCLRRRLGGGYLVLALASPLYWILISAAAWKGFAQLIRRPHFWEKTDHGLFAEPEFVSGGEGAGGPENRKGPE
jgi:glycosyltransferase XagB